MIIDLKTHYFDFIKYLHKEMQVISSEENFRLTWWFKNLYRDRIQDGGLERESEFLSSMISETTWRCGSYIWVILILFSQPNKHRHMWYTQNLRMTLKAAFDCTKHLRKFWHSQATRTCLPWEKLLAISSLFIYLFICIKLKTDRGSNRTEFCDILDPNLWKAYICPAGPSQWVLWEKEPIISPYWSGPNFACVNLQTQQVSAAHHMTAWEHNPEQLMGRSHPPLHKTG
jgi:hypothetical protein